MPIPVVAYRSPAFKNVYKYEVRSLYRALLRECTYLPDAIARSYAHRQITTNFRKANQAGADSLNTIVEAGRDSPKEIISHARRELRAGLKKGYKGLGTLQKANDGEIDALLKVLLHAYGRAGPRRHVLLRPLIYNKAKEELSKSGQGNTTTKDHKGKSDLSTVPRHKLLAAPEVIETEGVVQSEISNDYPKLQALVHAQSRHTFSGRDILSPVRTPTLRMPARNIWGDSMPRRRVRNALKKWKVETLSRLYPPLPEDEHQRLIQLITGQLPTDKAKPRRLRAGIKPESMTAFDLEKLVNVRLQPWLALEEGISRDRNSRLDDLLPQTPQPRSDDRWLHSAEYVQQSLGEVLEDSLQIIRPIQKHLSPAGLRGHNITPRLMRRLLHVVYERCPYIELDECGEWQVTWGQLPKFAKVKHDAILQPFFENVPCDGKHKLVVPLQGINRKNTKLVKALYRDDQ